MNYSHPLVQAIQKSVKAQPKPCVNISGGIDSTIILHHLSEKTNETIYTYTVGFSDQEPEYANARQVSDHYETCHKEIFIKNMLNTFPEILKHFSQPRFNLWPYWLAKQAFKDQRISCYIGEGGDEHFGGYWYKPQRSYVEHWASFFTYVYSTYKTIYDIFPSLSLIVPMHPNTLSTDITYPYYDFEQNKRYLREAYKNILPDFVVERKKLNGRKNYNIMWQKELKPYFPNANPQSEEEIKELWNGWVYREWLRTRELEPITQPCNHRINKPLQPRM